MINFPAAETVPDQVAIESALAQALAYLNDLNQGPFDPTNSVEVQKRTLSYGKCLRVLPLPGHPSADLASFDAAPDPTTLPTLASVAPYTVSLFISQASGLTQVLAADGEAYVLTGSERLLLNSVAIAVEES